MAAPLLLTSLISLLGPQILGRLFGGGSDQEKLFREIQELLQPGKIAERADALAKEWYRSPSYGAAQTAAIHAGNKAQAEVGRAGAGVTSGMDVLRSGAAAGLTSGTLSQVHGAVYNQSREMAQRQAEALASARLGVGASPNMGREMLGASFNFLGPLFGDWFRKRYGIPRTTQQTTYQGSLEGPPDRWS